MRTVRSSDRILRGCTWSRGVYLPGGGGSTCPGTALPVNRMADRCKNITLATSLRTVKMKTWSSLLVETFSQINVFFKDVSRSVNEPHPVGCFQLPTVNVSLSFKSFVHLMLKHSKSAVTIELKWHLAGADSGFSGVAPTKRHGPLGPPWIHYWVPTYYLGKFSWKLHQNEEN